MYISKFYSDEWMRDNGFLEERTGGTVAELLKARTSEVIFAKRGDRIDSVVEKMRQHGISQMPVAESDGKSSTGMIHEVDLLNAIVTGKHRFADSIDPIIAPLQGVVQPTTSLTRLSEV